MYSHLLSMYSHLTFCLVVTSAYAGLPATIIALLAGPRRLALGRPHWGRRARPGRLLAAPRHPWATRTPPVPPVAHSPGQTRWQRERGSFAAALRTAGGGQRFPRTPPELAEPPAPPADAGTPAQRPGATATVLLATAAATSAALGGGGAAAFRRPQRLRSEANGTV